MKRILSVILAAVLLACGMALAASAADVAVAAAATDIIPTIDGKMDDVYKDSTPLTIGAEGDDIWGKAYFAYDPTYLYVYFEVHDTTVAGAASGNITPAYNTDTAYVGINLMNQASGTAVWGKEAVNEKTYFSGLYGVMRTAASSTTVWEGGHAQLNGSKGYKTAVISTDEGYTAECRIRWGVDMDGNEYDTATLFQDGISVVFGITDAETGAIAAEKKGADIYTSNGCEKLRMMDHLPYTAESGANVWQKLEFTTGEFKEDRAELTTAPTTPAVTTPKIVTVAPVTTPKIVTVAPVTTPQVVTVAPVTSTTTAAPETTTLAPETSTPAPETTTPAPETTTPVPETTPAPETQPTSAESSNSNTTMVIVIAVVAVVVIAAVVVLIVRSKKKK